MTSSSADAASGVAAGSSFPVDVFKKSAPLAIATAAAALIVSGSCSTPVSRMTFSISGWCRREPAR